jgi:hypothetical protein
MIDEFIPDNGARFLVTKTARQSLELTQFPVQWKQEFLSSVVKQPSSECFPLPPSISGLKKSRCRFAPSYDFTSYTRKTFLYFTLLYFTLVLNACGPHPYKFPDTFTIRYFRFE